MPWFWERSESSKAKREESGIHAPTGFIDVSDFTRPSTIVAAVILASTVIYGRTVYKTRLSRIGHISGVPDSHYRKRSVFGRVLSVGDADNFRLYHTPGGVWTGFTWLRSLPSTRKAIYEQTLHIRIAGVDAPELAHFGKPAQPNAEVALEWLRQTVQGKKVRCILWRRDQYDRVVATVLIRRVPFLPALRNSKLLSRDVGLEMLQAGWATVYEAKQGSEFGGPEKEKLYRETEARAKKARRGMWGGKDLDLGWWQRLQVAIGLRRDSSVKFETPREYKTRMAKMDQGDKDAQAKKQVKR